MTEEASAESDFVALRVGQGVGRYTIGSVLGQGGFGITYRATDSQLGRDVAIKEYLPAALAIRQDGTTVVPRSKGAADDFAWGRDRFVAEGRTLAALHRAPGIVRVHDFLEANGTAYLVMELLGGETLEARLARQGTLDAAAIDRIVQPLLDGLEQVHAAGYLHRDIKPANILLDAEGRPTLIDFGASRAAVAGRSQAMTAIFTPGYAAVEQFTAATQGPWTDIYGLAATLHHAVAGQVPPNSIDRVLDDTYVSLATTRRDYPPELLAGIDAGLAVRASDRPQSIAAWRPVLAQQTTHATVVMRGAPTGSVPTGGATAGAATSTAAPPAPRRRGVALAAGGVAVVAMLGAAYVALSPTPPPISAPAVAAAPAVPAGPTPQELAARRAQEELEQVRRDQQAAAEEVARLRAEADARRKADEEAALRRKIEDELRQKAEADEAARRQAEQDAKQKADAEAAERLKAEEGDKKGAELAETALRLSQSDRQRLQVALTALGFPTGGTDGVFGARSREVIAAWQRKAGRAATGYLTADQQAALLRDAAPALARYDEEQKKLAEPPPLPAVRPPLAALAQGPAGAGGGSCEGTFRSQWCRAAYEGFPPSCWSASMTIRNGNVSDGWGSTAGDGSQRNVVTGTVDPRGNVVLDLDGVGQQTHVGRRFKARMTGSVSNGVLAAAGRAGTTGRDFTVRVECR